MTTTQWQPLPTGQAIPFSAMQSSCPSTGVNTARRWDPFWTDQWATGSQATWLSRASAERRQAAGLGRMPAADARLDAQSGLAQLVRPRLRQRRLDGLAGIGTWRTVTVEQIAAFSNAGALVNRQGDLDAAYAAGIIDRGRLPSSMIGDSTRDPRRHLYRPAAKPGVARLAKKLTAAERRDVLAGWEVGTQQDRHNLLAAELGLRIAEFAEIGAVLGEGHASFGALSAAADGSTIPAAAAVKRRCADLAIVRTDGYRIGIEVTATLNERFPAKALGWAKLLMGIDPRQTGLAVVFVEAGDPDRSSRHTSMTALCDAVSHAAYAIPGASRAQVPQRMAVARWRDWFPAPGCATAAFRVLEAARPTGPPGARWEVFALLDICDLPFDPTDPELAITTVSEWSVRLGGPHWLRAETQL